ncbi:MAG: esterase-like activity of phytase family protein, partial [Acidobacteriota bacterium]
MRLAVFGLLSLALCSRLAGALEPAEFSLRLVGSQAFPDHAITVDGVTVGGLSGLDFDPTTGRFLAISDDPSTPGRTGAHLFEIELTY